MTNQSIMKVALFVGLSAFVISLVSHKVGQSSIAIVAIYTGIGAGIVYCWAILSEMKSKMFKSKKSPDGGSETEGDEGWGRKE